MIVYPLPLVARRLAELERQVAALKVRNGEISYHVLKARDGGASGGRTRSSRRHTRSATIATAAAAAAAASDAAGEAAAGDASGEIRCSVSKGIFR